MAKVNTFAKSERVLSMYVCMGGSRNKIGWQNCSESQMYTLHKTYHQIIQWDDGTTERSANIRTDQLLTHLTTFVCRYVSRILYTYWQTYAQIYTHTYKYFIYIYIYIPGILTCLGAMHSGALALHPWMHRYWVEVESCVLCCKKI